MRQRFIFFIKNLLFLVFAILFWCLSAHFLNGICYYVVHTLVFATVSAVFLIQKKVLAGAIAVSSTMEKRFKIMDGLCIFFSIMILIFLPFVSAGGSSYVVLTSCVFIISFVGVFSLSGWLLTSGTSCGGAYHGNIQLGLLSFSLLLILLFSWSLISFRAHISLKMIYMVLSFTALITIFSYTFYHPDKENNIGTICAFAFISAILLVTTLNAQLGESDCVKIYYTVVETGGYHNSAVCKTDSGEEFNYTYCPYELGERAFMYRYEGWFNEPYYIDSSE